MIVEERLWEEFAAFSYFSVSHLEESAFAALRETASLWAECSTWPAVRASLELGLFGFIDRTTRSTAGPVIEHPARDADRKVKAINKSSECERFYARMKIFTPCDFIEFLFDWTDCWIEFMNRFLVRTQRSEHRFVHRLELSSTEPCFAWRKGNYKAPFSNLNLSWVQEVLVDWIDSFFVKKV